MSFLFKAQDGYKAYPFLVVSASGKIISGWDFREDAKDFIDDNKYLGKQMKILTSQGYRNTYHKDPTDTANWTKGGSFE